MRAQLGLLLMVVSLLGSGGPVAAEELVLDDFEYADETAARQAWRPDENSPPVLLEPHGEGQALKMLGNFATNDRRVVYDRTVNLDLSRWSRFSIEIQMPKPTAFAHFTVYFRSTGGWYGCGFAVSGNRWETINFSRAEFRVEGQPAGWHDITGVRLSAWAGAPVDAFCMVDNLQAYKDAIVLLTDPQAGGAGGEGRAARQYATTVATMLREYGVHTGAMSEAELLAGELPDSLLIILAYNPHLSPQACQRLMEYIQAGGKLIVFYALRGNLGEALGLKYQAHVQRRYDGQFATIKLDTSAAEGLPAQAAQNSWNIAAVEPVGRGAKVIGQWYDSEGQDTGYPALVMSDSGAFMSHVLLADDPTAKGQMLLALVGHFAPEAWETAGNAAAMMPAQVGHLAGDTALEVLTRHYAQATASAEGRKVLAEAKKLIEQATAAIAAGEYVKAVRLAGERDRKLQQAYMLTHKSRAGEFRACWEHSGTGAYPEGWDKSMRVLAECGFNAVMPNSFWGGSALYKSELLPVSPLVAEKGDQIQAAVEAGKQYGIEVHPWKVNFNTRRGTPKSFLDRMRAEGRLQVSISGEAGDWLCPSHPANQELEIGSMVEVATKYEVAGVHFDYIRYPDSAHCYCEGCRRRFQETTGITVANWPQDLRKPEIEAAWLAWRAEQITHIVRETSRRVHAVRPECKVSAAVFNSYPGCYHSVGQDWVRWAKEGYVDFLCPMDYTNSDYSFAAKVVRQLGQVEGAVPVYPGIGASSSSSTLTPDRVAGQIAISRNLGTGGFIVFNYTASLGNEILPELAKGITSAQTYVPHHGPRFDFRLTGPRHEQLRAVKLEPGQEMTCTIGLADQQPGPEITEFAGEVVLENPQGKVLQELGRIGSAQPQLRVQFKIAQAGIYVVALRGKAVVTGLGAKDFTACSMPLVCGDMEPSFGMLLGAE